MKVLTSLVVGAVITLSAASAATSAPDTAPAVKAADAWVSMVDKGQYKNAWQDASQYLKQNVTLDRWQEQVKGARQPLGKVVSRKVKSTQYTKTLPGAPDGEYVVIQYDTSFAHKKAAVETVTPMKQANGEWKVSGYFIR